MTEETNQTISGEQNPQKEDNKRSGYNYPGFIAGILMIILPFTGKWWYLTFGSDALYIAASPFSLTVSSFGDAIISPILNSLTLAVTVITILFGVILIAGSYLSNDPEKKALSGILIGSGSLKALFVLIMFFVAVIVAGVSFSQYFSVFGFNGSFPLIYGYSEVIMNTGDFAILIPVNSVLSPAVLLCVFAAIFGIASRIYAKK